MPSLETRVIGTAVLSVLLGLGIVAAVEVTVGFPGDWTHLVGFLIVAGFGVVAPQLYLAAADDSISPTTRYGLVLVLLLLIGSLASSNATTAEVVGIWSVIAAGFLGIGIYQFRAGYRATSTD